MTLTIMGQRVFPQRKREPLHKTQRLLPDARAVIWLSAATELLLRFMWSSSQLSVAFAPGGLDCRVMLPLMIEVTASYAFRMGKAQNSRFSPLKIKQVETQSCQEGAATLSFL